MQPEQWARVDDFINASSPADPALESVLSASIDAGMPEIAVSKAQGRFLSVLAAGVQAESILEIGTLGGFSAISLARVLPNHGHLVTLEANEEHAAVARRNVLAAGLTDRVSVVIGRAVDTLPTVHLEHPDGFDFIFIDADKESYPKYWEWSLKVSHPGTMIVADNVVRNGAVADKDSRDPRVLGVRKYLELAAAEQSVATSVIQTVGAKGYDGLSISVVLPDAAAGPTV